jgi:hypothetical protein
MVGARSDRDSLGIEFPENSVPEEYKNPEEETMYADWYRAENPPIRRGSWSGE